MLNFINKITAYLTIPLVVIVVYCALMRYIFHAMPDWGFEMSIFIFGIQAILGGVYCHASNGHVSVDIFSKYLSDRMNLRLKMMHEIAIIFVCLIILFVSYEWAWNSFQISERSIQQTTFNPPIWWFKAIVPISAFLMSIQSLLNFKAIIRDLKGLK